MRHGGASASSKSMSAKKLCEKQLDAVNDGGSHGNTKTAGELAILTATQLSVPPGETERNLKKISPCQHIKNEEEEKGAQRVRVTPHLSCPEDLITAFIRQSEAEWGKPKDEASSEPSQWWVEARAVKNVEDSCSEPSQWWGETPVTTDSQQCSLTPSYELDDPTPESESNVSLDQESSPPSLCEPDFPDVPIEIWGGCWSRVLSKPWEAAEPQCILEARGAIVTLKHMCRPRANFARRHLIIGDAMAVVLALTKGRSSSSVLLSVCRQWCAFFLAADIYPHVRWVPSQRNAADDSSRNRSRHLVDSDVAETQISPWAAGKDRKLARETKRDSKFDGLAESHATDDKSNIESEPQPKAKGINAKRRRRV